MRVRFRGIGAVEFHRLNAESPNRLLARRDGQSQTVICEPARFFSREKAQKHDRVGLGALRRHRGV